MSTQDAIEVKKTGDRSQFRPWMPLTFLIGAGFFTMGLMDPLYDSYLPIFLGRWIKQEWLVGSLMALDNALAILLIPVISAWSDRTRTPIGRRMPFILVTLPITAILFALIPWSLEQSLIAGLVVVFALNLFKQAARGPVVALMPDLIPGDLRSEANGVINTMGGIAAIVGTVGLAKLMDVDIILPLLGATKDRLPFPIAGLLVILAVIFLARFIRETPVSRGEGDTAGSEESVPFLASMKALGSDKSALRILFALFFWFLGYQGILPFIGKYSVNILGTSMGNAPMAAGMVGIAYALFAVPSGYLAHRLGRKKTIRVSLLILTGLLVLLFFFLPITKALGLVGGARMGLFWALLFVFGTFWVSIVTNSFPMLWQMASFSTMGIYTGLYYTFSQAAAITSPPLTGLIIDTVGYPGIFLYGAACMLIAFAIMAGVDKGEPEKKIQG